jgi:hypothetical protein
LARPATGDWVGVVCCTAPDPIPGAAAPALGPAGVAEGALEYSSGSGRGIAGKGGAGSCASALPGPVQAIADNTATSDRINLGRM